MTATDLLLGYAVYFLIVAALVLTAAALDEWLLRRRYANRQLAEVIPSPISRLDVNERGMARRPAIPTRTNDEFRSFSSVADPACVRPLAAAEDACLSPAASRGRHPSSRPDVQERAVRATLYGRRSGTVEPA